MMDIHTATGLPWFLTIPLISLGVSTAFRLPFSIYNQRTMQRRAECNPLVAARKNALTRAVMQREASSSASPTPAAAPPKDITKLTAEIAKDLEKSNKKLYRKLGLQQWKLYAPFLAFPAWVLAIDSIRRLSGARGGLLSAIFPDAVGSTASTSASSAQTAAAVGFVDPTLATEGCLWFMDLTAADPTHILPFALSAVLLSNLMPRSRDELMARLRIAFRGITSSGGSSSSSEKSATATIPTRVTASERASAMLFVVLMGASAAVGPVTLHLPAAIHLYWISSSLVARGFRVLLDRVMPIDGKMIESCKGALPPFIQGHKGKPAAPIS